MKHFILSFFTLIIFSFVNAQSDTASLKEFTGRYIFPEGNIVPEVSVLLQGVDLSMTSAVGTSALSKIGVDSFSIVDFNGSAVFKRNDNKIINGVHIEASGYVMDGTKDENNGWSFRVFRKTPQAIMLSND